MDRTEAHFEFYRMLEDLSEYIGGIRTLKSAHGRMKWPDRGVYFLYELGEWRAGDPNAGYRVINVGTHAVSEGSRSTLWSRLRQHRGTVNPPGGNHRGSVLRKLVGECMMARTPAVGVATWGMANAARKDVRDSESALERLVSRRIGQMRLVFLPVEDEPGPGSLRAFIKRNAVALLSTYVEPSFDAPSPHWLGNHCGDERVRCSGLWNRNHVDEEFDPDFLELMRDLTGLAESFMEEQPDRLATGKRGTVVTPFPGRD